ncbi:hypothetical protein Bca52824_025731 [Brassica carinata]|uniref:Jacalin-type lectin domain-containing protein n=1 Tax=Brassica carinata TaxID=52824 RepID=A0A8X7SGR7_BRACI|nr:hypothetical protein Bca52824_025731 [Brassica carinata]
MLEKYMYIGQGQDCIAFVKFEYVDGSQVVVGDKHGKQTLLGVEEFEVDEDDYIIYVEAFRANVTEETIVALKFETYKGRTNQDFKTSPGVKFVLQGGKIVGFHGRSTDVLNSLGAYVSFPSTPELLGKWIKSYEEYVKIHSRCMGQVGLPVRSSLAASYSRIFLSVQMIPQSRATRAIKEGGDEKSIFELVFLI